MYYMHTKSESMYTNGHNVSKGKGTKTSGSKGITPADYLAVYIRFATKTGQVKDYVLYVCLLVSNLNLSVLCYLQ